MDPAFDQCTGPVDHDREIGPLSVARPAVDQPKVALHPVRIDSRKGGPIAVKLASVETDVSRSNVDHRGRIIGFDRHSETRRMTFIAAKVGPTAAEFAVGRADSQGLDDSEPTPAIVQAADIAQDDNPASP